MMKVITLSGMHQAGSIRGWDSCKPVESVGRDGKPFIGCAGTKAITLAGTRKHSDKELTAAASHVLNARYSNMKCDAGGHCVVGDLRACKPRLVKMKNGRKRCRCGNRFVKRSRCSRKG